MSRRYEVRFDVEVPDGISFEHVLEWARFQCNDNSTMLGGNPLMDVPLEPMLGTFEIDEARR